ncbi:MAG: hypothetical protein U5N26_11970 [Candidatus Marinimicrobia bacterium]|nr:hypothetical protein [Candidatus Neomarinimicrobiota bacterium]
MQQARSRALKTLRISIRSDSGEALPSIASVSMVEARSCLPGEHEGNRLTIHGGEIRQAEPVPMKPGTHISVRRLFYNTPARRKFLRTPNAEYRHIIDTVRRFALGYPQLRIQLFSNGNEVFILEPSDLGKRITDVFQGITARSSFPLKPLTGLIH